MVNFALFVALLVHFGPNQYVQIESIRQNKQAVELRFEITQAIDEPIRIGGLLAVPTGGLQNPELIPTDSIKCNSAKAERPVFELTAPMVFRDFRVVAFSLKPYRNGWLYTKGIIRFRSKGGRFLVDDSRPVSATFLPLYKSLILNFKQVEPEIRDVRRGGYLIIVHDSLASEIEPLAEWRRRTGYHVRVVRLSEISPNPMPEDIRNYILDAYRTWELPPDFVLLVGDNYMPFGTFPYFTYEDAPDDAYYGMLEGDDYLPEVMVGRLAVDSRQELQTVVMKTIAYETDPLRDGTDWLRRALLVAGVYIRTDTVNTTKLTKLRIRDDLLAQGFEVDTVFWNINQGGTFTDIVNSINSGVGLVNYRGWSNSGGWVYPVFYTTHIQMLQNGFKLPVMFSISCGTGNFASPTDPCFGETWIRAGTPSNPSGGVAFVGPSDPFTHTKWNNAIDMGMFWGMFAEGLSDFGTIVVRGLMELIPSFPEHTAPGDEVEFYFHVYTVLGDPALKVWTDVPQPIDADFTRQFVIGTNLFELTTVDEVENGYVSVTMDGELLAAEPLLDGHTVSTVLNIEHEGWLVVTVTGRNRLPFIDSVLVSSNVVMLSLGSSEWTEISGNGDDVINPGERFSISPTFRNTGTSAATNITAILRARTPYAHVTDSVSTVQEIHGGSSGVGDEFVVEFADFLPDGEPMLFEVEIRSDQGVFMSAVEAIGAAGVLWIDSVSFNDDDGNGYLEPNDSAYITLTIKNIGGGRVSNLSVKLRSGTNAVEVIDSTLWVGTLSSGESLSLSGFRVFAMPDASDGRPFALHFEFESNSTSYGTQTVWRSLGIPSPDDPLGPDPYGYWLYEDIDTAYDEAPEFQWIELDPNLGGSGTQVSFGADELAYIDLPFTFRFYGQDYDQITVSLNGWLAFDSTELFYYRNWPIPSPLGPERLVAPFWDDLTGGHVFVGYVSDLHAFVVEWAGVLNRFDNSTEETFEVLLFDPQHCQTATGDGEIVFQYLEIADVDTLENYSTVGIESHDRSVGLQYVFARRHSQFVDDLRSGRAIKFTTDPPDSFFFGVDEDRPSIDEGVKLRTTVITQKLTFEFQKVPSSPIRLEIYDVSGRSVLSRTWQDGSERLTLNLSDFPDGVYLARLECGRIRRHLKFVKISR